MLVQSPEPPVLWQPDSCLGPQLTGIQAIQVHEMLKRLVSRLSVAKLRPESQEGVAMRFFRALGDIQALEQKFVELYAERNVLRDSTNVNHKTTNQGKVHRLAEALHKCMKELDSAWRDCRPYGLTLKEAMWRQNTLAWLQEALVELRTCQTLPPLPEQDTDIYSPAYQASMGSELDAQLWKQERDTIAEAKRLRRLLESERSDCRRQMSKCHDEHTALRKQLRAASEAADHLYSIQREAALAAEDAARLAKNLAMADAAARKADLIKLMQLDSTAHQLAMDHLIAQQQKNHTESSGWEEKRTGDVDNLETQLLQLMAAINTDSALLQGLQERLRTEQRLKNNHDLSELSKTAAQVAKMHAAKIIQRAWREAARRPRIELKKAGKGGKKGAKGAGKKAGGKKAAKGSGGAKKAAKGGAKKGAKKK